MAWGPGGEVLRYAWFVGAPTKVWCELPPRLPAERPRKHIERFLADTSYHFFWQGHARGGLAKGWVLREDYEPTSPFDEPPALDWAAP
jgi:hypothetical protein